MKIVFTANGRCASAAVEPAGQPITAGSRGIPAEIHLSQDYDGLVVTAFFRSDTGAWPVVLGETPGKVTIPWEAMEKKSLTFDVGVVGKNGDGTIVIPTIWARAGKIVPATEDSGLEPGDPSADIGAQIVEQARAAAKKAEDAAEAAEEARDKMPRIVDGTWRVYNAVTESWEDTGIQAEGQDGVGISDAVLNADYTLTLTFTDGTSYTTPPIRGPQGQPGQTGATPDISIGTVETLPPGSPATATITGTAENPVLSFGIPQGQQGDPGEVTQAEFDELADEVANQKSVIDDLSALVDRKTGMLVDTASGAIASFVPDATIPDLLGVTVDIEPVQSGSGDPSPDNVRPICGWDSVELPNTSTNIWDEAWELGGLVNATGLPFNATDRIRSKNFCACKPGVTYFGVSPTSYLGIYWYDRDFAYLGYQGAANLKITAPLTAYHFKIVLANGATTYNHDISINYPSTDHDYHAYTGNTYSITLGQTVYGCKLTIDEDGSVTALVDRAKVSFSTATGINRNSAKQYYISQSATPGIKTLSAIEASVLSNQFKPSTSTSADGIVFLNTTGNIRFNTTAEYASAAEMVAALGTLEFCYPLASPIEITLDPVTVSAISNQTNNVWSDAGDVSVTYAADIKAYIDRLNQSPKDDMIANTLIAANKYFTVNNRLFLSTASIAAGAQIIPGTNCTETSLVEALNALNA